MKQLSQVLRERRTEQGHSLEQVSKELKIKEEFLEAIEEGRYKDLPSDTYAAGFVKNYAEYLGIPEAKSMALFRRDYKVGKLDYVPSFRKKKYIRTRNFFLSLKGGAFVLAALLILVYLAFQFSSVFLGPSLVVQTPQNGTRVAGSVIEVKGETEPYALLEINGESSYVGLDGTFRKSLYVFSGNQTITIVAKNRFGKETVEEIVIEVE